MKFQSRNGFGGSAGETDVINAAAEVLAVDVEDLQGASLYVVQATDAGTVSLIVEESPDGALWAQVGTAIAESDFPAGANTAVLRHLESGNGMPRVTKLVRVRAATLTGGGVYRLVVAGVQRTQR